MPTLTETSSDELWHRQCIRSPIPEIEEAAILLSAATEAHLAGDLAGAEQLIRRADMQAIGDWVAPLLGNDTQFPDRAGYVRYRQIPGAPPVLPKADRLKERMPTREAQAALISLYGLRCVFCEIPLIRPQVRSAFVKAYPHAVPWGKVSHAAFLAMWLQFDHVVPHSRGGGNSPSNIVVTCSGCNYGRMSYTLEEIGVTDPRLREVRKTEWDGLERFRA